MSLIYTWSSESGRSEEELREVDVGGIAESTVTAVGAIMLRAVGFMLTCSLHRQRRSRAAPYVLFEHRLPLLPSPSLFKLKHAQVMKGTCDGLTLNMCSSPPHTFMPFSCAWNAGGGVQAMGAWLRGWMCILSDGCAGWVMNLWFAWWINLNKRFLYGFCLCLSDALHHWSVFHWRMFR